MNIELNPECKTPGVYGDIKTRNLVFQERGEREDFDSDRKPISMPDAFVEQRIKHEFPNSGIPVGFRFSKEYYERIKDEKKRMKAYRGVTVSTQIPDGKDAEIEGNPWKFLYIPENADAGYVRAAKIRLSQIWHPDGMDPRNPEKIETVFKSPHDFPLKDQSPEEWLKELADFQPKSLEEGLDGAMYLSEEMTIEEIQKMDPEKRKKYLEIHEKRHGIEEKAEIIRRKMVEIATEKMKTINSAARAANKKLGVKTTTLAGYDWQKVSHLPWVDATIMGEGFGKLLIEHLTFTYTDLKLEGDGVIRKHVPKYSLGEILDIEDRQPRLTFDFGDVYLMRPGYRQAIDVRALFTWLEIRMNQEVAPSLMDGVVEIYSLNLNQRESLRLMLMNGESEDFITEVLGIPHDIGGPLARFVGLVNEGPYYSHYDGPARRSEYFNLGVEFSDEGELILKYVHQDDQVLAWGWSDFEEEARFTKDDVELMRAIAYGPLLNG